MNELRRNFLPPVERIFTLRTFFSYLKSRVKVILVFAFFCTMFTMVIALYQLPVEAVCYAAVVCAFFGVIFIICDCKAFYKKHNSLEILSREAMVTIDHLPAPTGLLEQDYQKVIHVLYDDKIRMADKLNGSYTDLVEYYTVWAHQIKTPIAAMRLILQEAEESEGNRELCEELQSIEQYVEMVLCYLRLDSESTDYIIKKYSLDSIVRQAVRKYASQFIRKRIKLNYEPFSCNVLTDEKWLLFVLEQVLSNALKYTMSGSVSIIMQQPMLLCIRDTGIGIAPEDLPRIFEKGFTGYNGRSDKKASGIGLYLCRRICDRLGHKITVSSVVGEGTAIYIDLKSTKLETE